MNPSSVLVLTCLLLIQPPAFGSKSPPPQSPPPTQPEPTQSTNITGQCNAGYWVQGPLVGPPGRDSVPGRDGLPGASGPQGRNGVDALPGPPGPPGPSGVNFDEIRKIVRLIMREEMKNMTAASPGPIKVVMECSNSTSGLVRPPFQSTSTLSTALPTTTNPSYRVSNTSRRHCPGLTSNNPAKSCRDILLCNSFLPSGYYWIERNNSYNFIHSLRRLIRTLQ